jgi:hypothetical protein
MPQLYAERLLDRLCSVRTCPTVLTMGHMLYTCTVSDAHTQSCAL